MNTFLISIVLFGAIIFSMAFLGQLVVLIGYAIHKQSHNIHSMLLVICSAFWALFFFLTYNPSRCCCKCHPEKVTNSVVLRDSQPDTPPAEPPVPDGYLQQ